MTSENESFIIGQAYLSREDTEGLVFVLRWLRDYYIDMDLSPPRTIISDASKAALAAIKLIWPEVPHLLCIWHVNKDVEARCKILWKQQIELEEPQLGRAARVVRIGEKWQDFRKYWYAVLNATTPLDCDTT